MTDIDPVTQSVLRNAVQATTEEMTATLVRTAYSPNITERRDCSCALFDASGALASQAETIPVHLGAMPFSVAAAIDAVPPDELKPGDAIALNDPFSGGAHLPDVTLVSPVFVDGDVVAYAANRAHHADIGGATAGSVGATATEIYQEGLRIPPVKLVSEGDVCADVLDLVLANVRTPDERRGDLRAQIAANATGRERFTDLCDEHGVGTVTTALDELQAYSERRMRAEIEALPDGTYHFVDHLDDDGRSNDRLRIEVVVDIDGDGVTVDFSGTAEQTEGPVNAVFAVTASATYFVLRAMTDPDIPPNAGCYRPIDIEAPEGTIVNANPPAAVVGGNLETSQRVVDVVLGALAEAAPEAAVAGCQGTMNNLTLGGTDPRDGTPYAFYETEAGGFGGRATGDGMDAVHAHMSNTLNTPVEVLETAYPLRVERYALRPDSGGAGEHRGGLGLVRELTAIGHTASVSVLADRRETGPYGLQGGDAGAPGAVRKRTDGEETSLAAKTTLDLDAGETIVMATPGGGGYGDPSERDVAAIKRDLQAGKVSREAVEEDYDVDIDAIEVG
jgi:N-methylhydantoinase B